MEVKRSKKDSPSNTWKKNYVPCIEMNHFTGTSEEISESRPSERDAPPEVVNTPRCSFHDIRKEFQSNNFGVSHTKPYLFATSAWQNPNKVSCLFLTYRIFWGIYFPMWTVWSIVGFNGYGSPLRKKVYYLLYATNWSMLTLSMDVVLQAINAFIHAKHSSAYGNCSMKAMSFRYRISWILSNISSIHMFIPIIFWTAIDPNFPTPVNEISINTHIVPGAYILLDTFISSTPKRLLHAFYPMFYMTLYGLFTIIYYICGGLSLKGEPAIYPILDWRITAKTFLSCAALVFILIPLLQLLIFVLYKIRRQLVLVIYRRRRSSLSDEKTVSA